VNREEIPVHPIYRDPVSGLFMVLLFFFDLNCKNSG
jgi:hypothetical protein